MNGANNNALLTYAFSTYPSPIQTSTPQSPLNASINIGVISPSQKIYCNEITVAVPVGADASALTDGTVDTSLNTAVWSIVSTDPQTLAALHLPQDDTYFTVTFVCKDPTAWLINYNLVFGLAAQVNQVVGDFTIQIYEKSGTSPNDLSYKNPANFTLAKETPQFFLQNLVATAVGSSTVPATEFTNGQDFNLAWESNGTFFQVYEKGNPTPVYSGMQTTCPIKGGVETDTTFFLVAMMTSNPGGHNPVGGYAPIYLYEALTVTVSNPSLTPTSVTASGDVNATGNLGGKTLNITGSADLGGATTIGHPAAAGKFLVNLSTELKNNLKVEADSTLNDLTVSGVTKLEGQVNLADTNARSITTGNATVNGTGTYNSLQTFLGGVAIWGAPPTPPSTPSHLDARNGFLYMGWMPPIDESVITFKLSDGSGMLGYNGSSRKLKDDIQEFSDDFHKILKANPVSFVYKGNENSRRSIGYIAEDFHDLGLRDLLVYDRDGEPAVIKYDRMALYHQQIIKELKQDVETLKEAVKAQAEVISALERSVEAMEKQTLQVTRTIAGN